MTRTRKVIIGIVLIGTMAVMMIGYLNRSELFGGTSSNNDNLKKIHILFEWYICVE